MEKNNTVNNVVDEVIEHFYYNRKLVLLNIENYPEEIFNTLSNYVTYNCSKDLSQIEYSIAAKKLDLQDVLDTI